MRSALGALVIALGFACASVPPPQELDALRREAMVHSDIAALRELFADGLRYGHANGDVHAKEELLGLLGSGRLDYRAIRIEEIETREQAGTWVVTGRQTVEVTAAGREVTSHSVFSAVYARECRHWQLVAYQSTPLQAPPSGGASSERSERSHAIGMAFQASRSASAESTLRWSQRKLCSLSLSSRRLLAQVPATAHSEQCDAARHADQPGTLAAIDALLILLADHELNASTFAARVAASTHADVYAVVQAGLATLSGPLHGATSDRFEALLAEVGAPELAERAVQERARRGERVPGFGHAFYGAAGDARARMLLELAWERRATPEVAVANAVIGAMERANKPPPNVDSGAVVLRAALGMPAGAVAGLFAVGRAAGWVAHALEQVATGHLLRPRARYIGPLPDLDRSLSGARRELEGTAR